MDRLLEAVKACGPSLADAHAHPTMYVDMDGYLRRRMADGVDLILAAGTCPKDWPLVLDAASRYRTCVLPAIGLHPWNAAGMNEGDISNALGVMENIVVEKAGHLAAISECGLDAARPNIDNQVYALEAQLRIAKKYGLPIVLHCVKSYHLIFGILRKVPDVTAIFHGFDASPDIQRRIVAGGHYVSIGRKILNGLRYDIIPGLVDRVMLETDDDGNHTSDLSQIYRAWHAYKKARRIAQQQQ